MMESDLESGVISKRGIVIERGEGCYIWDTYGNKYLDMGASYGVCNIGHGQASLIEAVKTQSEQLFYVSSSYDNPTRTELMRRLIDISPFKNGRVFLCNSGTEAVEAALKFALDITGKKRIIAAKGSFHGRTMGALSLTFNPKYRKGFEPFLGPVDFVRYGDLEEMEGLMNSDTAAVILEPIQGEGGIRIPPSGYFQRIRELCDQNGSLLIVDEVQTGLGRTGTMFAIEQEGVIPDIMCIGKSLGGGIPIGATLLDENMGLVGKGRHGSTFGGSPIACSAANAALSIINEQDLPERSREKGEYFLERLASIDNPLIREVRGKGLMIGVELKKRAGPYLSALLKEGVAAIPAGSNVIRFLPPLTVEKGEIDSTVTMLQRILDGT
jgi:acetylornithine/LysW-gamma-L-lysine aminotransferase